MMSTGNYTDQFKQDAVAQLKERGYRIREVSERVGVSLRSRYAWRRKFGKAAAGDTEKDVEIRRLKREPARVSKARATLKETTAYFAKAAR